MDKAQGAGVVDDLFAVIESRKGGDPKTSYVAKKFDRGIDHIAKKVGEEGVEVAIAAALRDRKEIVSESADLLFHLLVLWSATGVAPADVFAELGGRRGISGLEREKKKKSKKGSAKKT
jgi:phosphoribosyl-ATP pyrophosphohydrolase